jgi:hypothetical protein
MEVNKRNSSSGILILFMLFFLFSLIHKERESSVTGDTIKSSVITDINSPGQAVAGPAISAPEINYFLTTSPVAKFACLECSSIRELIYNNIVSSSYSTFQFNSHSGNSLIRIFFLPKVPEQGKDDDIRLIA